MVMPLEEAMFHISSLIPDLIESKPLEVAFAMGVKAGVRIHTRNIVTRADQ